MKKQAFVILSFIEKIDETQLLNLAKAADAVICADGGQMIAREYGIIPDCVIGDFDSTKDFERFSCKYITLPTEKNLTDAEAAINYAIESGFSVVTVYGGIGGRLDHTLGNIGLLEKYTSTLESIIFIDGKNYITLLDSNKKSEFRINRDNRYKYLSFMSLDKAAIDVSITGAKYELNHATISRASTLCISNEFNSGFIIVKIGAGKILLIKSNE